MASGDSSFMKEIPIAVATDKTAPMVTADKEPVPNIAWKNPIHDTTPA